MFVSLLPVPKIMVFTMIAMKYEVLCNILFSQQGDEMRFQQIFYLIKVNFVS